MQHQYLLFPLCGVAGDFSPPGEEEFPLLADKLGLFFPGHLGMTSNAFLLPLGMTSNDFHLPLGMTLDDFLLPLGMTSEDFLPPCTT